MISGISGLANSTEHHDSALARKASRMMISSWAHAPIARPSASREVARDQSPVIMSCVTCRAVGVSAALRSLVAIRADEERVGDARSRISQAIGNEWHHGETHQVCQWHVCQQRARLLPMDLLWRGVQQQCTIDCALQHSIAVVGSMSVYKKLSHVEAGAHHRAGGDQVSHLESRIGERQTCRTDDRSKLVATCRRERFAVSL